MDVIPRRYRPRFVHYRPPWQKWTPKRDLNYSRTVHFEDRSLLFRLKMPFLMFKHQNIFNLLAKLFIITTASYPSIFTV